MRKLVLKCTCAGLVLATSFCSIVKAQTATMATTPDWCKELPRKGYEKFERVPVADAWFEVYKVAPGTIAIYEPRQSEETISYLILGKEKALLLDTGMGISDLKKVVTGLTKLPVIVVNSHTHDDHVGSNWQFETVYGMDTDFTRKNAQGSREDAQAEIAAGEVCGELPKGFDREAYMTRPWKIAKYVKDGEKIELGGRTIEILATPGHTPDAAAYFDRANGLLFTGDSYYPGPIWLYRPETDLAAYEKSIRRMAALEPQVKVVLGQHNMPVAPPSVLHELVESYELLKAGKVECKPAGDGKKLCRAGKNGFLVADKAR